MSNSAAAKPLAPRVISHYTQTAIEVRAAELLLWLALTTAGAQPPKEFDGLAFAHWPTKDRGRVLVRAAIDAFPTPEVKAKARAYTRLRDECIKANIGLVHQIAGKLQRKGERLGLAREDLVQEGVLGLQRALETFDSEAGTAFATYSYFWIYHHMNRSIENSGLIRVPTWARATRGAGAKAAERILCIDEKHGGDDGSGEGSYSIADNISVEASQADELEEKRMSSEMAKAILALPPREARVIRGRFYEDQTLSEVGADLGVSRERVRQIEAEALSKLEDELG